MLKRRLRCGATASSLTGNCCRMARTPAPDGGTWGAKGSLSARRAVKKLASETPDCLHAMTKEQAATLRPGDIIEFSSDCCYWLAKLVKLERPKTGKPYWIAVNHGGATHGISTLEHPENASLVGHSDAVTHK